MFNTIHRRFTCRFSRALPAQSVHLAVVLSAVLLVESTAFADDQSVPLKAQARALFEEAKALAEKGRYAEACPKFEESQRLDAGLGTKYYLADCFEHIGRFASAWGLYMEVSDEASEAKMQERSEHARKRADAIQPKLTRMIIVLDVDTKSIPGIEVRRDGVVVPAGLWGVAVPVDAAQHKVSVGAPSKQTWVTTVEAAGEGATVSVTVPRLSEPPPPPPVKPLPGAKDAGDDASKAAGWPIQRIVGVGMAGVGLVGLGLGIGLGADASGKVSSAKTECNDATPAVCTQAGVDLLDSAKTSGTVSTVGFIAGGALLAGGAVLFFTASSGEKASGSTKAARRSVWITPHVASSGNGGGVAVGGVW